MSISGIGSKSALGVQSLVEMRRQLDDLQRPGVVAVAGLAGPDCATGSPPSKGSAARLPTSTYASISRKARSTASPISGEA